MGRVVDAFRSGIFGRNVGSNKGIRNFKDTPCGSNSGSSAVSPWSSSGVRKNQEPQ